MKAWARRGQRLAAAMGVLGVALLVGVVTNGVSADDDREPRSRATVDSGSAPVTDPGAQGTATTLGNMGTAQPAADGRRDKQREPEAAAEQEKPAERQEQDALDQERRDDLDVQREDREAKSKRIYEEIEQQFLQEELLHGTVERLGEIGSLE